MNYIAYNLWAFEDCAARRALFDYLVQQGKPIAAEDVPAVLAKVDDLLSAATEFQITMEDRIRDARDNLNRLADLCYDMALYEDGEFLARADALITATKKDLDYDHTEQQ